ncbi:hypothetical protein ZIOFF_038134 [Zingiber officinale]|uniref:Staygreen protein domain-containing protein n=1 Tax=Zingiber officinale TaxID=94328 RepID=A0A8J5GKZ2_ZINOF|nr:hypothetical protein ZIOFF_038134 [Zingiber officinale]
MMSLPPSPSRAVTTSMRHFAAPAATPATESVLEVERGQRSGVGGHRVALRRLVTGRSRKEKATTLLHYFYFTPFRHVSATCATEAAAEELLVSIHPAIDDRKEIKRGVRLFQVARLFGRSIFEASKLKVLFLGAAAEEKQPGKLPRTYTLTHSDVTSTITLAISGTVNSAQGWYNRLQRDEVVAEWEEVAARALPRQRRPRPVGPDRGAPPQHLPQGAAGGAEGVRPRRRRAVRQPPGAGGSRRVGVYFHSNLPEFNSVESWGSLREAASSGPPSSSPEERPRRCGPECEC